MPSQHFTADPPRGCSRSMGLRAPCLLHGRRGRAAASDRRIGLTCLAGYSGKDWAHASNHRAIGILKTKQKVPLSTPGKL